MAHGPLVAAEGVVAVSPEEYAQLREVYMAARELPDAQRADFVARACARDGALRANLDSLLRDDASAATFLDTPPLGRGLAAASITQNEVSPTRRARDSQRSTPDTNRYIGPFRILGVLGEGGMGIVYEAEQQRPRRRVALKVMRPQCWSAQAQRRFEHEAQVLRLLQHPGIVQVYEAGFAEVRGSALARRASTPAVVDSAPLRAPYFAMELVRGRTLTEHAAAVGLDIPERLRLMARVCDAVQHAHERGVVHRDLKPANILLSDETKNGATAENQVVPGPDRLAEGGAPGDVDRQPGKAGPPSGSPHRARLQPCADSSTRGFVDQPKILDFGVARITDSDVQITTMHTNVGQLIGTLAYMSPEQVAGDSRAIDLRSDVYSLGVILYELLTGRLPYDVRRASLSRAAQLIRHEPPRRPSSIDPMLRGDLETIVLLALEKDRARRYTSAGELARDLRRYLNHKPIAARPPTLLDRLRKLVARHRTVALLAGLLLICLIAATVARTLFGLDAQRRRDEADEARTRETPRAAKAEAAAPP